MAMVLAKQHEMPHCIVLVSMANSLRLVRRFLRSARGSFWYSRPRRLMTPLSDTLIIRGQKAPV